MELPRVEPPGIGMAGAIRSATRPEYGIPIRGARSRHIGSRADRETPGLTTDPGKPVKSNNPT